jgi:hypothetical protein
LGFLFNLFVFRFLFLFLFVLNFILFFEFYRDIFIDFGRDIDNFLVIWEGYCPS